MQSSVFFKKRPSGSHHQAPTLYQQGSDDTFSYSSLMSLTLLIGLDRCY